MQKLIAEKIGDFVEDKIKDVLGIGDDDKDKDKDKEGGFFSRFTKDDDDDKDEDKQKGGIFSIGDGKKDEDKGFFSNLLDKDKGGEKKSGFSGLFADQDGSGAAGGGGGGGRGAAGGAGGGGSAGGGGGGGAADVGGDLFSDLCDVAEETSRGN